VAAEAAAFIIVAEETLRCLPCCSRGSVGKSLEMRTLAKTGLLAALLLGLTVSAGSNEKFRMIQVADLEAMQRNTAKPVTVYDANDIEFREKNGVIPGAKLLDSFNKYDVKKELPADKSAPLVFYCSNKL
jgi:hypothetical protein